MSPASGDRDGLESIFSEAQAFCFHSINVPSEWGQTWVCLQTHGIRVSIQLMSPASGDTDLLDIYDVSTVKVSIQLMSPASGDFNVMTMDMT